MTQVQSDETDIPAQQNQTRPHSRISRAHGHQSRAPRFKASSGQGPGTVDAIDRRESLSTAGIGRDRFEKRHRLLDEAAFGRVFRGAHRSRDAMFTVLCRPNEQQSPRLGLAIAKKHCKHATARNRLKRVVRESFRQHKAQLAGLDIVVMNQPAATLAKNPQLFASLDRHWRRLSKTKRTSQES
jgi:ribonuclease P protein component